MSLDALTIGTLYIAASFLFAGVYYLCWRVNPDAFIVHQEMNLRPIKSWRGLSQHLLIGTAVNPPETAIGSLEKIYVDYSKLVSEEIDLSNQNAELKINIERAKTEEMSLGDQHSKEVAENMRAFTNRLLANDVTFSSDDITSDLSRFTKTSALPKLDDVISRHNEMQNKYLKAAEQITNLRQQQRSLIEKWEKDRLARLTFLDFVYFSMGVATTNTFGDIIPNDKIIRAIIVAQLVSSIVLVGLFVNAVAT
jgi:hypothetical protein